MLRAPRTAGLWVVAIRVIRSAKATTRWATGRRWASYAVQVPGGQRPAEGVPVLDAGVHPLPAGGAVHVGGVAGQQQPSAAEVFGDPVLHPEPGGPDQRR